MAGIDDVVYIGSHLKAEAFGGMNGDPNPSSLLPGQKVKRGSVGKKLMEGTEVNVPVSNAQTRTVSAKPYPTHAGTKGPSTGAKVPAATVRRDKTGIARPTR